MFKNAVKYFEEMEVKQCLLEVIQSNTSAFQLYKKQGFEISREFECFNLDKTLFNYESTHEVLHIDITKEIDWIKLMSFWDFKPSWQNSIDSIISVADTFICSIVTINDVIVGYGIINKNSGDIPQIAVDKKYRGNGIGSSILIDLLKSTKSSCITLLM